MNVRSRCLHKPNEYFNLDNYIKRNIYAGWRCYFIVIFTIRNQLYGLQRNWESISVHEVRRTQTDARIDCKVQSAEVVEWASNRNAVSPSFSASRIVYLLEFLAKYLYEICSWPKAFPRPKPNDEHIPVDLVDPSKPVFCEQFFSVRHDIASANKEKIDNSEMKESSGT